jgi:peptide/nickel transport system substrate-binding protein
VDRVLEGEAAAVLTVNPPVVLGRHTARVKGVPHDPREAARLLEAAAWRVGGDGVRVRDGERLRLTMLTQPGSVDPAVAQFVQAELARVGIEVEIEQLDPGAYSSRINSGRFDLDIELPNQNDANPAFLLALRWYPKSEVASATFMAAGARYDTIIDQALAARDREQVQEKTAEAMHLLLDEQVGAIPLAGIYRIYAMKNRVQGFEPHPSKTNQWWNTVWLAR